MTDKAADTYTLWYNGELTLKERQKQAIPKQQYDS